MSKQDAVCVAYVHDQSVTHSFSESLQQLLFYDMAHKGRVMEGGFFKVSCGTDGLVEARNKAVAAFLETDETGWLLWADTDMGFKPDSLERLIASADPVDRPIVGGLCFANKQIGVDGYGGYRTAARVTIMDWLKPAEDQPATFTGRSWYPPDTLVSCAGTGSAFILIHRSVFAKIEAEYGPNWYARIRGDDGLLIGEDLSFCMRANALGFPIHVDTSVKTTHMKTVWLGEDDFWEQQTAPYATEPVVVLVDDPSDELLGSLYASTGLAITQRRDKGWGPEPWVFLATTDTRFGPGWYDHALRASAAGGAAVVGTGGGLLVARSYIAEQGASWDGPGSLFHDGYDSGGELNEIIAVAQQRGTYVTALAAKVSVESPPEVGKHDKRLFEARSRKYGRQTVSA